MKLSGRAIVYALRDLSPYGGAALAVVFATIAVLKFRGKIAFGRWFGRALFALGAVFLACVAGCAAWRMKEHREYRTKRAFTENVSLVIPPALVSTNLTVQTFNRKLRPKKHPNTDEKPEDAELAFRFDFLGYAGVTSVCDRAALPMRMTETVGGKLAGEENDNVRPVREILNELFLLEEAFVRRDADRFAGRFNVLRTKIESLDTDGVLNGNRSTALTEKIEYALVRMLLDRDGRAAIVITPDMVRHLLPERLFKLAGGGSRQGKRAISYRTLIELAARIEAFRVQRNRLPESLDELTPGEGWTDAWNQKIEYAVSNRVWQLSSLGPDGARPNRPRAPFDVYNPSIRLFGSLRFRFLVLSSTFAEKRARIFAEDVLYPNDRGNRCYLDRRHHCITWTPPLGENAASD